MARVIFVEGFPGAGKSTTAQFLARQLARHGRAARWVYEEEVPHPLVPDRPAGDYRTWEQFAEARVAQWRGFANAAADAEVTIVPESALLQGPVFTMLTRDADAGAIEKLVGQLVATMAPLRPTLVYLSRRDPRTAFRALGEQRGMAWLLGHAASSDGYAFTQARGLSGLDGLLAYWRAHAELCDALVERLPVAKLVLDVGENGWGERRRQVCDFVGVPFDHEPSIDAADLARLTGRYSDGKREVTVEIVDARLVLRGVLWFTNALLPVARNVFDVEAWPFRIVFEEDASGAVWALHWRGPRLSWGGPTGVFARVRA